MLERREAHLYMIIESSLRYLVKVVEATWDSHLHWEAWLLS